MSFILAFDVSKGESYKVLYHDRHCLSEGKVLHNQEGFRQLLEEIIALPEMPEIVFEATGVYSRPLEKFCQDHLLAYCLLNPLEAKKQMEEAHCVVGKQIKSTHIDWRKLIGKIRVCQKYIKQKYFRNYVILPVFIKKPKIKFLACAWIFIRHSN